MRLTKFEIGWCFALFSTFFFAFMMAKLQTPDYPSKYTKLIYSDIYPGIDAVFYGNQNNLEYDLCVAPFRNPQDIRLSIEGAKKLSIDNQGNLIIYTDAEEVMQMHQPIVYQWIDQKKTLINANYILLAHNEIGFVLGDYDIASPLVIDPLLSYSTYLGEDAVVNALVVDSLGNAYVTGKTSSPNFPTTSGAFQTVQPDTEDIFITKLNPTGTALVYSTYLGGTDNSSEALGIDVDSGGNAYVTGYTFANTFPTSGTPFQNALAGAFNAIVTKLDPSGSNLTYSTYLGGSSGDQGNDINVDSNGDAYVVGQTSSANFPITPGAFQTVYADGGLDAFVTKLNSSGSALIYSTFLGGSGVDNARGVALFNGNAYVTGNTGSMNFPITPGAFQTSLVGFVNAFVSQLNSTGSTLLSSTYLGGTFFDFGNDIDVDSTGNAYVVGQTQSANFPTTLGAFQTLFGGGIDAFVTKLNATQTSLIYSTYLGGSGVDFANAIVLDGINNAYVTGGTNSMDFPTTADAFQTFNAGGVSAYVTRLNSSGSNLVYSTYLGGSSFDFASGIDLDPIGGLYVAGQTGSTDFPTTAGAFQTQFNPGMTGVNGFITKFINAPIVTGLIPNSGPEAGGTVVTITGTGFINVTSVLFGGVPAVFIVDSPTQITAISPPGVGVVHVTVTTLAGTSEMTPADLFTYIPPPPPPPPPPIIEIFPPIKLKGVQRKNEFATQTDIINILTWKAPNQGERPVEYRIYRNPELTRLISVISANERLRFEDHNRKKGKKYTYWIVSVDAFGNFSEPAIVRVH